jgi:hypothetical protein
VSSSAYPLIIWTILQFYCSLLQIILIFSTQLLGTLSNDNQSRLYLYSFSSSSCNPHTFLKISLTDLCSLYFQGDKQFALLKTSCVLEDVWSFVWLLFLLGSSTRLLIKQSVGSFWLPCSLLILTANKLFLSLNIRASYPLHPSLHSSSFFCDKPVGSWEGFQPALFYLVTSKRFRIVFHNSYLFSSILLTFLLSSLLVHSAVSLLYTLSPHRNFE